jgi:hypothetical protein
VGFLGRVGASTRGHVIGDPALCFGHLGRGEPERGTDVLGADLDAASALARVVLPRALVETAGDDDSASFDKAQHDVLGEVAPADDVEERRRLLPLV